MARNHHPYLTPDEIHVLWTWSYFQKTDVKRIGMTLLRSPPNFDAIPNLAVKDVPDLYKAMLCIARNSSGTLFNVQELDQYLPIVIALLRCSPDFVAQTGVQAYREIDALLNFLALAQTTFGSGGEQAQQNRDDLARHCEITENAAGLEKWMSQRTETAKFLFDCRGKNLDSI